MNLATFIYASVSLLIQFYADQYEQEDLQRTLAELEGDKGVVRVKTYDFIIVGGGTAGCLLAGRLSNDYNVLLLEAGGNPPPSSAVRAFVSPVARASKINYFFPSIPQPGLNGRVMSTSIGKMMGGSGSHNSMIHNRGNPQDFNNWARIVNDDDWTYKNVLKYFTRGEKFVGELYDDEIIGEEYYGYDGELGVDTEIGALLPKWFQAGEELGFKSSDPNGYQSESFAPHHKSIYNGSRVTPYSELIKPIESSRQSLTVLRYADVHDILIDDESLTAYGVEFKRHGIIQRAKARNEVILSCGAFRSPLLLMKSGIGPMDVLNEAGIKTKLERDGVGKNLGEHIGIVIGPFYVNDTTLLPRIHDGDEEVVLDSYHENGSGLLGQLGSPTQAFIVSTRAKEEGESEWPDIRLYVDMTPNGYEPLMNESLTIHVMAGRLKQRGYISLNTTAFKEGITDDTQLAIIDFGVFNDPKDLQVVLEGIQWVLKIAEQTQAFQSIGTTLSTIPIPECSHIEFRTDDYWRCVIRGRGGTWNHLAGTCSMGHLNNPSAVVDSQLRVIGVKGLRVIDGSVMPVVPNANTNAAVIMIAEKGVDYIRNTYPIPITTTTTELPSTTTSLSTNWALLILVHLVSLIRIVSI